MNLSLIAYLVLGAVFGTALGFSGKHPSEKWSLPANWRRGAFIGASIGLVLFLLLGSGISSAAMDSSTANVKSIGQDEFEAQVINSPQPVLVDFYATWCGPCQALSPRVDKVAGEFAGKIKFVKVNVDKSPALAQRFGIDGIPSLLLFKGGKVADTIVGLQSEAELKAYLEP
jgi:thioredoxin 1